MLYAGSGSEFSYNDYNYDNTNSNVSAHVAIILISTGRASWQKITNNLKGVGNHPVNTTYKAKAMKRITNIYEDLISIENLLLADKIARRGKSRQTGIIEFDKNFDENIAALYRSLVDKTYKTSAYSIMIIHEPKERIISILPYKDRLVHHAVMNKLEAMFVAAFTADSYSCIKGKGIHAASRSLRTALSNEAETLYCIKLDVKKFYPNIAHDVLKAMLRKKIKDQELLWLLDGIIDSSPGMPIGNYLSQYFANFYLTYFDHWLKEQKKVKHYFRYADDMVILHSDKEYLHRVLKGVSRYLEEKLKLQVKANHQIFPVKARGIDFVGYVHFHTHVKLRKSIKQRFARTVAKGINPLSKASYLGWAKHCNSRHLIKKLLPNDVI